MISARSIRCLAAAITVSALALGSLAGCTNVMGTQVPIPLLMLGAWIAGSTPRSGRKSVERSVLAKSWMTSARCGHVLLRSKVLCPMM